MSAVISPCGMYRYKLERRTNCPLRWVKPMYFVMLNPSTADEVENDPTINKCIGFAERHSHTNIVVLNLFAYRATDQKELDKVEDPIGDCNDAWLKEELTNAKRMGYTVVAGWGKNKTAQK